MKRLDNESKFILGGKGIPQWFIDETARGRAKVIYDDDGDIEKVIVYSGVKSYQANEGDTIMKTKTGMVVIPKDAAKKYGIEEEN